MSKTELSQNLDEMNEDQKLHFYENVFDDMIHDKNLRIDGEDYESDLEDFWAMNVLHHNHFQLFFTFYGLLALFLSYVDYKGMGELTLTNVLFFEGGVALLIFAYMIYHHESRHDKDYKAYIKKRLSAFNKAKNAI
ncbi:hypothetical protein [Bacteriovorax sp. DB6_IX]|uniref:hypothetical protein n=1 Tax=Bacteriovorax sp. DB6_IX TaxID=1353530 RepID=UPI000412DDA3|nr:hypothetical protein [Bacteriovorax sp. DB6_IX]